MALFKRNPNKIKLTHAERTYQTIIIIIVGLVTLTCLFPLLYVIGMSFTGQAEMIEKELLLSSSRKDRQYWLISLFYRSQTSGAPFDFRFPRITRRSGSSAADGAGGYVLANKADARPQMVYDLLHHHHDPRRRHHSQLPAHARPAPAEHLLGLHCACLSAARLIC